MRKSGIIKISLAAGLFATLCAADPAEYVTADGACLAFDAALTPALTILQNGPTILFTIDADFPSASIIDDASQRSLTFSYWKRDGAFESRTHQRLRTDRPTCQEVPADFGLMQQLPILEEGASSAVSCNAAELTTVYLAPRSPVPPSNVPATLSIQCRNPAYVPNCTMRFMMPNDWEARISLPKTHLSGWRDAAQIAQAFFDDHLTDCDPQ